MNSKRDDPITPSPLPPPFPPPPVWSCRELCAVPGGDADEDEEEGNRMMADELRRPTVGASFRIPRDMSLN